MTAAKKPKPKTAVRAPTKKIVPMYTTPGWAVVDKAGFCVRVFLEENGRDRAKDYATAAQRFTEVVVTERNKP